MALRDQPYIPLYVKDFLCDTKLRDCDAESVGVYIMLMCVLHSQEEYGKLLLSQKFSKTDSKTKNFAMQLSKQLPYDVATIERSLQELLNEDVIQIKDDVLLQKRMVRDGEVSEKRALAGKKGANSKYSNSKNENFAKDFAIAKSVANSEYEYAIENEIEIDNENNEEDENQKKSQKQKPVKEQYAEFVSMTNEEYTSLVTKLGEDGAKRCIEILDNYKGSKGIKYNSDYRAILNWVVNRYSEEKAKKPNKGQNSSFDINEIEKLIIERQNKKL